MSYRDILEVINKLDKIENAEESVLNDPQALIDLSDMRSEIREAVLKLLGEEPTTAFCCPKCKGIDLGVNVIASARLVQNEDRVLDTDNLEAIEWGDDHTMWCNDCGYSECAASFRNPNWKGKP